MRVEADLYIDRMDGETPTFHTTASSGADTKEKCIFHIRNDYCRRRFSNITGTYEVFMDTNVRILRK
jgi:hypothetical protein